MKIRRQMKILEIIEREPIATQEDLAEKLREAGFEVTQATVSRDIKELSLLKVPAGESNYRYGAPREARRVNNHERLRRIFSDTVLSIEHSENLIVIKTLPGNAMALASVLDAGNWSEIIGTVGGDDTILVVVKPKEAVDKVIKQLEELL